MDVFEAINGRRSIRQFTSEDVPDGDLMRILDSATKAPSAGNCQPWEFVVVKDPATKQRLARAALGQQFVAEAPVVIVVCANIPRTSSRYGRRGANLYAIQDTAAAAQNIHLAAFALGYGTCWVGAFDDEEVSKVIGSPEEIKPVAIIPLGKPAESPAPPPRLPLEKIVHRNSF
ncbi:MAG: nitroreductase family protein [Hadesarchaea archaeon]|nr:nitroreductase family protein [Hadesarchaea archaeon]